MAETTSAKPKASLRHFLSRPKLLVMLVFGFSSGLPFMLVGNTLGFWLREQGTSLGTIGFLSWVGLAYSFKFLWAPLVDKFDVPLIGKLGRRRGWILLSQALVAAALFGMATLKPEGDLVLFTLLAAIAAFASATQDVVIDAWRIEAAESNEDMALLSSAYQLGYRAALLLTDALILVLAGWIGWPSSYLLMAITMAPGILATLIVQEPKAVVQQVKKQALSWSRAYDAVVGPLIAFFQTHRQKALLILAVVSLYRLADFLMGPMANPFYADIGLAKETVGVVRGSIGTVASILGIAAGGLCAVRLGLMRTLMVGALIGPLSNLGFSYLAYAGPSSLNFAIVMGIDNFASGFAGTALVGYMSSLTNAGYTATQYALLSSFYTLLGKLLKGFTGVTVDQLSVGRSLPEAYALFFLGTALIGLPAFILCFWIKPDQKKNSEIA